jgi:hypothetical protein
MPVLLNAFRYPSCPEGKAGETMDPETRSSDVASSADLASEPRDRPPQRHL